MTLLYLSSFIALIAFLWFKTDAFYSYLSRIIYWKIIPIEIGLQLDLFFKFNDYQINKSYSSHPMNYAKFIKIKYSETFFGQLLGCWVCLITFLGFILNLFISPKQMATSIILSYALYFVLIKIYASIQKEKI